MHMVHIGLIIAALSVGCTSVGVWLAGNRAPVYNVTDASLDGGGDVDRVGEAVRLAARLQNWEVEVLRPNVLIVTKAQGRHFAAAQVSYDVDSFSIELRDSDNMKQGDGKIHKLYNQWVHALEDAIHREVATGG